MFARFTSKVYDGLYYDPISNLTATNAYNTTAMVGVGGDVHQALSCANDEAVVGIIGSAYVDEATNDKRLGNLGVICGPVGGIPETLSLWQSDNFYVQTAGSLDTKYYATPASSHSERQQWNRYRNTVFSNSGNTTIFTAEQETLLCPASMAITGVDVSINNSSVLAVSGIKCNYPGGDATTAVSLMASSKAYGDKKHGTETSVSCSANRFSSGMNVWTHPYTSRLQLRCRIP